MTRRSRAVRWPLTLVAVAVVAAIAFVAGRWTLVQPSAPSVSSAPTTYEVLVQTLERRLTLTASASWPVVANLPIRGDGTVTSVEVAGGGVEPGDVLLHLDQEPVIALDGQVPMFRTLERGTEGDDVRQLQEYLRAANYLTFEPDGRFGAGTTSAVRRWQDDVGWDDTGRVSMTHVVFLPDLPRRVVLSDAITVGATIDGAGATVDLLASEPKVVLVLSETQAGLVPPGTPVDVAGPDATWRMEPGEPRIQEAERVTVPLVPRVDADTICATSCDDLAVGDEDTQLPAEAVLVADVTGPVVPIAALRLGPDGAPFVVLADAGERAVMIRARANGLAVLDGVEPGDVVLLDDGDPTKGSRRAPEGGADASDPVGDRGTIDSQPAETVDQGK